MSEKKYTETDLKLTYEEGGREMAEFISYRLGAGKKVVWPAFEGWKKEI